jgi:hypothetical protein
MAVACWGARSIQRMRVALLDAATGAPDNGASNGWITDALVSIVATPQTEAGDEFTLKNGDGDICQYYSTPDRVKRVDPVVSLCQSPPQLLNLMLGGDYYSDGSGALGFQLPEFTDDPIPVSLEWWTRAWDGSAQAVIGSTAQYWHHVIPKVYFVLGAVTSEHGLETVVLNGKGEGNPNITGNGPFDDWPAQIATTDGITAAYGRFRESTLPDAACAYEEVTSAAS